MMDRANSTGAYSIGTHGRDSRTLQIVCADPDLTHRYLSELERSGSLGEFVLANSAAEPRRNAGRGGLLITLLDESAILTGDSLGASAELLCEAAPLVVVASRERQAELGSSIRSGWLDFVPRNGDFVSAVAGLIERRLRRAEPGSQAGLFRPRSPQEDFGEILRHEMNNPLTGILGNAELLLARRENLPPGAAERLEIITELAVRLRETVRHLSHTWQERRERVPSP
jgi:signal transduction histidine kinase